MKHRGMTFNFGHYENLLQSLDAICRSLADYYGAEIRCREACASCCIPGISLFPVEAWYIKHSLGPLQASGRSSGSCIFLDRGLCSVYRARPVLCRTQGFPLLYRDETGAGGAAEISACETNFTGVKEFPINHVIDMGKVNLSLAAVNIRFLHDIGRYEELRNSRFAMENIPALE